jgi:hypothetical protein
MIFASGNIPTQPGGLAPGNGDRWLVIYLFYDSGANFIFGWYSLGRMQNIFLYLFDVECHSARGEFVAGGQPNLVMLSCPSASTY